MRGMARSRDKRAPSDRTDRPNRAYRICIKIGAPPLTRREDAATSPPSEATLRRERGEVRESAHLLALPTRNPCLTLPDNDGAHTGTTVK
jgi:hypothetical protein